MSTYFYLRRSSALSPQATRGSAPLIEFATGDRHQTSRQLLPPPAPGSEGGGLSLIGALEGPGAPTSSLFCSVEFRISVFSNRVFDDQKTIAFRRPRQIDSPSCPPASRTL